MKIVFEGATYKTELLEKTLHRNFFSPNYNLIESKVEHVGYYYDSVVGDAIIILPKVFIYQNGQAFGKYKPQDILEYKDDIKKKLKEDGYDKILFELSTWIYQAISTFKKRNINSTLGDIEYCDNIVSNLGVSDNTELDIILSMLRFHKENQQLFTYVAKMNHGGQKIHWGKTVSKKMPHINNNIPIYLETISKKKAINFDEELILIFYSTLNHIKKNYGFNITLNENYDLIKGGEFDRFISLGTKRLKAIKYKYFSDKFILLWKLLYAYFDRMETTKKSEKKREEVLLVKKFNIVFEDMIDDLIADKESDMPQYFKDQKDGKQVDHIYRYKSLIKNDDIYFVGDSKYYKPENSVSKESVAKQFTYAKNVIQYNIDIFNGLVKNKITKEGIRYRDEVTEGYNITPNFFISALVDKDFSFSNDGLEEDTRSEIALQYHHQDRLFDRDTLLVQQYDINFLFVLSAYISRGSLVKDTFRNKARKQFRGRMIDYFNANYTFYEVTPKDTTVEEFVTKYFRQLNGKMYRPSQMDNSLIVAFEKSTKIKIEDEPYFNNRDYKPYILK